LLLLLLSSPPKVLPSLTVQTFSYDLQSLITDCQLTHLLLVEQQRQVV
jgi:hypothetical protein